MYAFRTGRPSRSPYPGDIKVRSQVLMLGLPEGADGNPKTGQQLVSTKPGDLDKVNPTDYGYSALSPLFERVQVYSRFELGYGQRVQVGETDLRYGHGIDVDASVSGMLMKGPLVTAGTPGTRDATNGVTRAVELNATLYLVNGRYVLQRDADGSFTVAKDFGSGQRCRDAIVFYSNMAGGAAYAYFAMGDDQAIWRAGPRFEQQTITVSGTPTGGLYSLQWNGFSTKTVVYNADAATVQAALREIPGLEFVSVASTGSTPNFVHTVTFTGVTSNPAQITSTDATTGGTHAIAHATTVAFQAIEWLQRVEAQTVTVSGTPAGGTFTLTYGNVSTTALAFNVGASAMQTALRLLTGLGSVEVTATGTSPDLTYTILFTGLGTDATQLSSINALTGGSTPTVAHATTKLILSATAWAIKGREFYRASNVNEVAKVNTDSDPFQEENWTAPNAFTAGDKTSAVVRMQINATGVLLIFKTDGVYVLDQAGEDTNLFPFLKNTNDATSGEALGTWLNDSYVSYGGGLYQIGFDQRIDQVGPETITTNDSDVKGPVTAVCGHDAFNLYGGLYNPDLGTSYLMKYGGWFIPPDDTARKIPVWHGSITIAFTSKITLLHKSAIGAPTGYTRMWIGFANGTYAYFILPITPNPSASAQYLFDVASEGEFYLPQFNGIFRADPKNFRAVTVTSLNASASTYAQVEYRLEPDDPYTPLGEDFNSPQKEKIAFPSTGAGRTLELKVLLLNTSSAASPLITSVGLHFQLRPALFLIHTFHVIAEDGLLLRNHVPLKIGARRIREIVKGLVGSTGLAALTLPDETTVQVSFIDYHETVAWDHAARKWRAALAVQAAEVVVTTRGTYGRLELYSYGELEAFTYSQLESL